MTIEGKNPVKEAISGQVTIEKIAVYRTARMIMDGYVYVRPKFNT